MYGKCRRLQRHPVCILLISRAEFYFQLCLGHCIWYFQAVCDLVVMKACCPWVRVLLAQKTDRIWFLYVRKIEVIGVTESYIHLYFPHSMLSVKSNATWKHKESEELESFALKIWWRCLKSCSILEDFIEQLALFSSTASTCACIIQIFGGSRCWCEGSLF